MLHDSAPYKCTTDIDIALTLTPTADVRIPSEIVSYDQLSIINHLTFSNLTSFKEHRCGSAVIRKHLMATNRKPTCVPLAHVDAYVSQWCRSFVKYGVGVSQVKPSNCFRLHLTSMIFTQQSRFLTACRRLEKLLLPSIFDTSLSSLMM